METLLREISMNISDFFPLVASVLGSIIVMQFRGIRTDLKDLNESVKELNIDVARVVQDQGWHKDEITDLKSRIAHLESRGD